VSEHPEIVEGRLTGARLGEAVEVTVRAFDDDPFSRYLFPHSRHRRRATRLQQRDTFSKNGAIGLTRSAIDDGRIVGVALWIPPGAWPLPSKTTLSQRVLTLRAYFPNLAVLTKIRPTFQAVDASHPIEPHWYLQVMTVDPSRQRQGIGGALLAPTLESCDADGLPAWLETQKEANVRYYERFGFQVEAVHAPTPGVPPLWTMRRTPAR
jgi:GNAT superfamily N-acetyltransferase